MAPSARQCLVAAATCVAIVIFLVSAKSLVDKFFLEEVMMTIQHDIASRQDIGITLTNQCNAPSNQMEDSTDAPGSNSFNFTGMTDVDPGRMTYNDSAIDAIEQGSKFNQSDNFRELLDVMKLCYYNAGQDSCYNTSMWSRSQTSDGAMFFTTKMPGVAYGYENAINMILLPSSPEVRAPCDLITATLYVHNPNSDYSELSRLTTEFSRVTIPRGSHVTFVVHVRRHLSLPHAQKTCRRVTADGRVYTRTGCLTACTDLYHRRFQDWCSSYTNDEERQNCTNEIPLRMNKMYQDIFIHLTRRTSSIQDSNSRAAAQCLGDCPEPCNRTEYDVRLLDSFSSDMFQGASVVSIQTFARVEVLEQQYTFDIHSLYSNIGGSLGLILGYSVLQMTTGLINSISWLFNRLSARLVSRNYPQPKVGGVVTYGVTFKTA